ncbi:MAG: GntR family transcriptional regulator [Nocardioides sp.]|nr:GntR family transcriptional regulator [Nocardioides sp.]
MTINPASPVSPSQQIAGALRDDIRSGLLPEGARLPSTAQLTERFGVAYQTARQAINSLKAEGLVEGHVGRGVFVKQRPQMMRLGSERYSRRIRQAGKAPFQAEADAAGLHWRQEILELSTVPAPAWVAEWFGIEAGADVFVRRRRTWIEDSPTQLADSYYSLDAVSGTLVTQENTGPGGSYARLEERGYRIVRFREELTSRPPTHEEAVSLRLKPGVAVIELHRIAFTETGPVEVFRSVMAGDRYTFAYEFEAPE